MLDFLKNPFPWYVSGALIGLMVPLLLWIGNKSFGLSASFRHLCAAFFPKKIPFFHYKWEKEIWNLLFVLGIIVAGFLSVFLAIEKPNPDTIDPLLLEDLAQYGRAEFLDFPFQRPQDLLFLIAGGFLIGFGSRYAGGCTSGHAIMGLSTLQAASLVAVVFFMLGGFVMVNFILPFLLKIS